MNVKITKSKARDIVRIVREALADCDRKDDGRDLHEELATALRRLKVPKLVSVMDTKGDVHYEGKDVEIVDA